MDKSDAKAAFPFKGPATSIHILLILVFIVLLHQPVLSDEDSEPPPVVTAKTFLNHLKAGDFLAAAAMTPAGTPEQAAKEFEKMWKALTKRTGPLLSVGDGVVSEADDRRVVTMLGKCKKVRLEIEISLDAEGKVRDFKFREADD